MNSVKESNELAKKIILGDKYRYLYGGKDVPYTKKLVNEMANRYPGVFSSTIKKLALEDADKGYLAIDCSGFVSKVMGVSIGGSSQFRQSAIKRLPVKKENAKPGMAIWKNGHIAYVGENLDIYEAAGTAKDLIITPWEKRASIFTELLVVKGSALAMGDVSEPVKKVNPYNKPTKLICTDDVAKLHKYSTSKYLSKDTSEKSSVKWVQYELNESGCTGRDGKPLTVDGKFGSNSDYALRKFQQSCKITVDGVCGANTVLNLERL